VCVCVGYVYDMCVCVIEVSYAHQGCIYLIKYS